MRTKAEQQSSLWAASHGGKRHCHAVKNSRYDRRRRQKKWTVRALFLSNFCSLFVSLSQSLETGLKYCNYFFTSTFVIEASLKLVAFGFRRFFKDRYNMGHSQLFSDNIHLSLWGLQRWCLMLSLVSTMLYGSDRSALLYPYSSRGVTWNVTTAPYVETWPPIQAGPNRNQMETVADVEYSLYFLLSDPLLVLASSKWC